VLLIMRANRPSAESKGVAQYEAGPHQLRGRKQSHIPPKAYRFRLGLEDNAGRGLRIVPESCGGHGVVHGNNQIEAVKPLKETVLRAASCCPFPGQIHLFSRM